MSHCDYCNEEIGYLPFKCKYCGGTFCQKHRLPENHNCSFNLKEEIMKKPKIKVSKSKDNLKPEKINIQEEDYRGQGDRDRMHLHIRLKEGSQKPPIRRRGYTAHDRGHSHRRGGEGGAEGTRS